MNNSLKSFLLMILAMPVIIPVTAQQQPEWQSQYAVAPVVHDPPDMLRGPQP